MSNQLKADTFDLLTMYSSFFSQRPDEKQLVAYSDRIYHYGLGSIKEVFDHLITESDRFPSFAELHSKLSGGIPVRDEAVIMSSRILAAVGKHGNPHHVLARADLGEAAWECVQAYGGWLEICQVTYETMSMVRAHLRDICQAYLLKNKAEAVKPKLIGNQEEIKKIE